jgi:hypothetical protein
MDKCPVFIGGQWRTVDDAPATAVYDPFSGGDAFRWNLLTPCPLLYCRGGEGAEQNLICARLQFFTQQNVAVTRWFSYGEGDLATLMVSRLPLNTCPATR